MKERKINKGLLKAASVLISCALPIWAICEKFPVWKETHGGSHSVGVGLVMIIIVLLMVFRKTVFDYLKDKINLKNAPPLAVWLGLLAFAYLMVYIGTVMQDMVKVFWMGFIGCAIGTFLTYLAERNSGDE